MEDDFFSDPYTPATTDSYYDKPYYLQNEPVNVGADGSTIYQNEKGGYTSVSPDGTTKSYDSSGALVATDTGSVSPAQSSAIARVGADVVGQLKSAFTDKSGNVNWGNLLATAGAIKAYNDASKPAPPTGYQGKIPNYTAVRGALPEQGAAQRPGAGGHRYFTDVSYADTAGLPAAKTAMEAQAAGLTAQNEAMDASKRRFDKTNPGHIQGAKDLYNGVESLIRTGDEAGAKALYRNKQYQLGFSDEDFANAAGSAMLPNQLMQWKNTSMAPTGLAATASQTGQAAPMGQGASGLGALAGTKISDVLSAGQLASLAGGGNSTNTVNTNATNLADTTTIQPNTLATPQYTEVITTQPGVLATPQSNDAVAAAQVAAATETNPTGGNTAFNPADMRAHGGLLGLAKGRYLQGSTDGMADKIDAKIGRDQPAKLSHGEFVIPADVVSHLGNGNSDAGAKRLYAMMDKIRMARTGTTEQGRKINPDKFVPGGEVKHFDGLTGSQVNAGVTGSESNLSNWAGPYVTGMLGKGQALSEMPYQAYQGPLTADTSGLQQQAFTGASGLTMPSGMGAYQPGTFNADAAKTYMSPYQQGVTDIEKRQAMQAADIAGSQRNAQATQQGAFGGSRQAIGNVGAASNLATQLGDIQSRGLQSAYTAGQQQFNVEQGRGLEAQNASNAYGMNVLGQQAGLGAVQRGITSEGMAADQAAFNAERDNPYKMVQYQQSLLQGLPLAAQSYNITNNPYAAAANAATGISSIFQGK